MLRKSTNNIIIFCFILQVFFFLACSFSHKEAKESQDIILPPPKSSSAISEHKNTINTKKKAYNKKQEESASNTLERPDWLEIKREVEKEIKALNDKKEVTYDIPITINKEVERFITYFQTTHRKHFIRWLSRSTKYLPLMRSIFKSHGLPEDLVYLALIESGFNIKAYSRAHACGPWQFIRSTARRYGLRVDFWVDERRDFEKSTHAAARYLADLHKEFGSWYLAAAAYNAGEARVKKALRRSKRQDFWALSRMSKKRRRRYLKKETRDYIPKFIAATLIAKQPEKYGFKDIPYQPPIKFDKVKVEGGIFLTDIARAVGAKLSKILELNPALRRGCTPPNMRKYPIRLPEGTKTAFLKNFHKVRQESYSGLRRHIIGPGDTLYRIALRYGIDWHVIKSFNHISNPSRLKIGQSIIIPLPKGNYGFYKAVYGKRSYSSSLVTQNSYKKKVIYTIERGDTLWNIARYFGVRPNQIIRWNNIKDPHTLMPGQQIVILRRGNLKKVTYYSKHKTPKKIIYRVKRGDSLWTISRRFGLRPKDIQIWNNLRPGQLIRPGDKLIIKVKHDTST